MRRILKWTGIILLIIIAGLYITVEARQDLKFEAPYPAVKTSMDSAVIARGKKLVFGPAHCANCHVPAAMAAAVLRGEEVALTGGNEFALPIGKLYSKNLTPHETGIGGMTDGEIARALRYGVNAKGNALLDFMPFHNTSDDDLVAIISYLRSQPPVKSEVPRHEFNLLGKAVKAFLIKPVGPSGPVLQSIQPDTTAEYGQYLANSVANCRGCHTNRDLMTGAFTGEDYAGGLKFEMPTDSGMYSLTTPNLTPHETGRIKGWTQEQFIERFRIGAVIKESHMPWGPFSRMSDDELKAIYKFLQTVKPVKNIVQPGLVKEKE
ncbi:cytochrome c [Pseudoflavitalea sp. X16]|uniref:c-type cytochrome n=1 Tax=Paraflavitalea devenefica TaxID=2716334 RepID=UPI0014228C27|nr:c-type cytochrome [Paraflavitalea devenefica]NII25183.1 cytochrome c [Paraflavitalea devenefica]